MEFKHCLSGWCFLLIVIQLQFSFGDYHCRRKGFACKNGGTCNQDGTCQCPSTHIGFDCSVGEDLVPCTENPCENNGVCYDSDKCSCSPEFYGERCQYKAVTSECHGSDIQMTYVTPDAFEGDVYVSQDSVNCKFNQIAAEVSGYKKYTLTIPFDTDNICSRTVNSTDNDPSEGDISRSVDVLISYNTMFISSTDKIIIYRCVHKGSNFTMFAALDDVGLNERSNLKQDHQTETYLPVRFVVLDKDGLPLEKPLFVGDIFKLLFFLSDTNVYETLRIEYCVANNTLSQSPIYFEFVEDGCPTDDGKNIMVSPEGPLMTRYSRPGYTEQLPASEILLYAFKFKGTTNVGFNCAVQICKKGDENLCQTRDCSSSNIHVANGTVEEIPALSSPIVDTVNATNSTDSPTIRRKRASTHAGRQFLSAIVTVHNAEKDGHIILPKTEKSQNGEGRKADHGNRQQCTLSQNIVIAIIVMGTVIFVLLVVLSVLSVSVYRYKRFLYSLKDEKRWKFNFTIPRPKLNSKVEE